MNLLASVMLVEDSIRPCRVEYDPDNAKLNSPHKLFKCLDGNVKKDDLVIVSTGTRHGMTVAKIIAIGYDDVPVDFENPEPWGWVIGPVPSEQYERILATEKQIIGTVATANANKMKAELKAAMGLGNVDFTGLRAALSAPAEAGEAEVSKGGPPPGEETA